MWGQLMTSSLRSQARRLLSSPGPVWWGDTLDLSLLCSLGVLGAGEIQGDIQGFQGAKAAGRKASGL